MQETKNRVAVRYNLGLKIDFSGIAGCISIFMNPLFNLSTQESGRSAPKKVHSQESPYNLYRYWLN